MAVGSVFEGLRETSFIHQFSENTEKFFLRSCRRLVLYDGNSVTVFCTFWSLLFNRF